MSRVHNKTATHSPISRSRVKPVQRTPINEVKYDVDIEILKSQQFDLVGDSYFKEVKGAHGSATLTDPFGALFIACGGESPLSTHNWADFNSWLSKMGKPMKDFINLQAKHLKEDKDPELTMAKLIAAFKKE